MLTFLSAVCGGFAFCVGVMAVRHHAIFTACMCFFVSGSQLALIVLEVRARRLFRRIRDQQAAQLAALDHDPHAFEARHSRFWWQDHG